MSGVSRITRLRVPGVFRDFDWPNSLTDFARYNLIYGWNGTGKTTLSQAFRALESRQSLKSGSVIIRIGSDDVESSDFAAVTLPVRVFNKDFVNEAVFPAGGGEVPPIFVVGKESVDKQKEVDRLRTERAKAEESLTSVRNAKQDAENALDRFCIERARAIKDTLRSSGSNLYNNFDKADYRTRAHEMVEDGDAEKHRLSDADHDGLLAQHRASPKPKLTPLSYHMPKLHRIAAEVSGLLSVTVVSKAIEELKDDRVLAEWIRNGVGLHQERQTESCLFCAQPLPSARLLTLEAHFSAEYEDFLKRLDAKIAEFQEASRQSSQITLPNKAELYDDLASDYESARESLTGSVNATREFLDAAVAALTEKKGRAFDRLALDVALPSVDMDAVANLNAVIRRHNQACDDFQGSVNAARDRVALDMIAGASDELVKLRDELRNRDSVIVPAQQEVRRYAGEIERLERGIVEHQQPAEQLNEDLHKYLGHSELKLEIRETGYLITRNGVPARALSEGETTAIALLYFLKSLQDRRFDLRKGIVVLDDPVSSLDANALYLAFGYIRERTKDAGQLFIFTHNFTFFRQVRNWFHHLEGQRKKDVGKRPARFYMLECAAGDRQRCSVIVPLDSLLERYESEYHYLFSRIYREASASSPVRLDENYALPNMARRVLEGFLAFRQPHVAGDLWKKLKGIEFDEARKLRILRFVHTYSHGDTIGEPEHDPSVLGEGRSVLQDLLDFMKAQDAAHFAAMEKLAKLLEEEGAGE